MWAAMETRTIGDLRVLAPDIDPRDLDDVTEPTDDDIVEAKVDGADWKGHQLVGARVSGSHLVSVNLAEAGWRNVRLEGCRLERVDLSGARFVGLTVDRCEFVGCRMTGVQLVQATLKNVYFEDCRLDYAHIEDVRTTGAVAWVACGFDQAVLRGCRLSTAAIQASGLRALELAECDLRGADLRGNDLSEITGVANLRGVRLTSDQLAGLAVAAAREWSIALDG
jgi:uncharacterized protein YjbI with pentapeptide repeats